MLALKLSKAKVCVGLGSACQSQKQSLQESALTALGYSQKLAFSALRFSWGYETTKKQLQKALKHLKIILKQEET